MNKKSKYIALLTSISIVILYMLNHALSSNTLDITPSVSSLEQKPQGSTQQEWAPSSVNVSSSTIMSLEIKKILETSSINEQQGLLKNLLIRLTEKNITEVASIFTALDLKHDTYQTLNLLILTHWAATSASDALRFSQRELQKPFKQLAVQTIISSQCDNSANLQDCVAVLPSSAIIDNALLSIANNATKSNQFSNAVLWTSTVIDEEKRNDAMNKLTEQWLAYAPEDAFLWAVSNSQFINIARQAINRIVKTDPWQAFSLVSAIAEDHGDNRSLMYKSIISSLIEDGDFLTVMSVLESTSQYQSIAGIAREWIEKDPKSALEWALNYEEFSVLSLRAMDEFTKRDHWAAYNLTSQITLNRLELRKDMFISIISDRADNDDYESIMTMLEKMPNNEDRETYYESFISKWAWRDPSNAMSAVKQLPDSPQKTQLFMDTITLWGQKEPLAALNMVQGVASKESQNMAIGRVIEGWAIKDIDEVTNWAKSQPSSPSFDNSLVTAITNLLNKEIAKQPLMNLVDNIADDTMRSDLQQNVQRHIKSDSNLEFDH